MKIDDYLALVRARRSARRFKSDPIPLQNVDKMLEAARWAMSGANAQPWEFVVVDDTAMQERIVDSWLEPRKEVYAAERAHLPEFRHPNFRGLAESPGFRDAPAALGLNSQWVSVSHI